MDRLILGPCAVAVVDQYPAAASLFTCRAVDL